MQSDPKHPVQEPDDDILGEVHDDDLKEEEEDEDEKEVE